MSEFRTAPMKDGIRYNSKGEPMTSSESQPRTRAGLDVMRKIDGNTVGPDDEEIYLDDILAVESEAWEQGRADFRRAVNKAAASFQENGEAEAAQDSRPLDVERLAEAIDASLPEWFEGNVDDWAMQSAEVAAAAIAAEYARLAAEKPHD